MTQPFSRRVALAAGATLVLGGVAACTNAQAPAAVTPTPTPKPPRPVPATQAAPVAVEFPPTAPVVDRVPAPAETIFELPGEGNLMAWTIDDGADSEVLRRYCAFAADTGTRLTMFVTGTYLSWDENVDNVRPLVDSGQVQLGNHTWTHADLTSLDDNGIRDELMRCHDFIGETFDVDARPFFRPPYGYHDDRVDAVAADLGYYTPTMWYGSLADSGYVPEDEIVRLAGEWFQPQRIVIGHINFEPVTNVFPQLTQILADRELTTVTLNDVYTSEFHP